MKHLLLDHGWIELKDHMGGDITIVNAARQSFNQTSIEFDEREKGLINYLMKNRHGCYDEKTEVLTSAGWKFWPNVTGKEEFLTLNLNTNNIEYQTASHLEVNNNFKELLHFKSSSIDLMVTPDHRIVTSKMTNKNRLNRLDRLWVLKPAKDCIDKSHFFRLGEGNWRSKDYLPNNWAKLIGFFIGDGSFSGTSVEFNIKKERKINYLKSLGFKLSGNGPFRTIKLSSNLRFLLKECYYNKEKIIPTYLLNYNKLTLEKILEGLIEADGHINKKGKIVITTTSEVLAGQLQELMVKINKAATVRIENNRNSSFGSKPLYIVTLFKNRNLQPENGRTIETRNKNINKIKYNKKVYCVTVPNGTLYVRRNGKPIWCGNTPFESVVFTFQVKCPIFIAREWFRHRIASYNELSGRYSKLQPEFYLPEPKLVRSQVGKIGNYKFEPVSGAKAVLARHIMKTLYGSAWMAYETLLRLGVAKEVARDVLPVATYTTFTWTINLRSLFNFINLRSGEHALSEIRLYSEKIEEIIKEIVPCTYEAFERNGRIAP